MTTPVSLHYRCQLPGGTKTGLPVFNDLSSVRTGPLTARVGLGRLLTIPRVLDEPVVVVVAHEHDLADPVDQQAVAALLADSESTLVITGRAVAPDASRCAVLDELQRVARSAAWFAPDQSDEDPGGRKDVLRACIQALAVGLEVRRPQVAELLNATPSWRARSSKGFTRQSIGHYVSPALERSRPRHPMPVPIDLDAIGEGRDVLPLAGLESNLFVLSVSVSNRDALSGAQRKVLGEIVRRSGGEFTGLASADPTAEERDQLDRVLAFVLDVVQGVFLDRPHPARNLDNARLFALSRNRTHLKAIAGELDQAGYLTSSTYGRWSTSSVLDLLKPPPSTLADATNA